MPLYDQKRKEAAMTPQFTQKAQQAEHRWLSPILPFILAAVSLIATIDPASLAAAAECQVTDLIDGGTIEGMTTWKGVTLTIPPLTVTVERDIYGGLAPSPLPETTPHLRSSRIAWGNTENHGIATIDACLGQDIRKSALFDHAMIKSIGKTQIKGHTQFMKVPALPYNGKRQVLKIRTTLPEIGISAHYKTATFIGPVQDIRKPILPDARSVSWAVARLPSTVETPSLFGGQPFVAMNPLQGGLQLPDNQSLRMNLTTELALHNGNCAGGCP
jgi:hypothetical protein